MPFFSAHFGNFLRQRVDLDSPLANSTFNGYATARVLICNHPSLVSRITSMVVISTIQVGLPVVPSSRICTIRYRPDGGVANWFDTSSFAINFLWRF